MNREPRICFRYDFTATRIVSDNHRRAAKQRLERDEAENLESTRIDNDVTINEHFELLGQSNQTSKDDRRTGSDSFDHTFKVPAVPFIGAN